MAISIHRGLLDYEQSPVKRCSRVEDVVEISTTGIWTSDTRPINHGDIAGSRL